VNRLRDVTHVLLRVVSALLFLQAGGLKMFGWFGGMPPGNALEGQTLAAAIIEVVCGPLILIGLWTRPLAFLASGEMAFAYFIGHFPGGFWPAENHGEAAVLLCFIFLFLSAHGAGPASVDAWLAGRARRLTSSG
jgi:putative oxidoreductase